VNRAALRWLWTETECEGEIDAEIRVHVREVQEAVRADHDHVGAGEGNSEVPEVQGLEGRAAARRLHGADLEEELKAHLEAEGFGDLRLRDHAVSQSIYLDDPDRNRLELYVDADPGIWRDDPSAVATSIPLAL
jgi:hypothetical protein